MKLPRGCCFVAAATASNIFKGTPFLLALPSLPNINCHDTIQDSLSLENNIVVAPNKKNNMMMVPFGTATTMDDMMFGLIKLIPKNQNKNNPKKKIKLTWEIKFAVLRAFKKVFGHCNVPNGYTVGGIKLGGWVDTQRKEYSKYCSSMLSDIINEKRIMRLERIGFEWSSSSSLSLSAQGPLMMMLPKKKATLVQI